jgi:hypothetical protein
MNDIQPLITVGASGSALYTEVVAEITGLPAVTVISSMNFNFVSFEIGKIGFQLSSE